MEIRGCHCAQKGNQPDGLVQNLEWISLLQCSKVTDKPLASEKSGMDARDLKAPLQQSNKLALGLGPPFPSLNETLNGPESAKQMSFVLSGTCFPFSCSLYS